MIHFETSLKLLVIFKSLELMLAKDLCVGKTEPRNSCSLLTKQGDLLNISLDWTEH